MQRKTNREEGTEKERGTWNEWSWLLSPVISHGGAGWRQAVAVFFLFLLCFFFLWLFAYSTAPLVSFLSLLWCWGRRNRWWCWVSSVGFLLPWPSLHLFSCYRFLVLLPLVLADGAVERWSWWWFVFLIFLCWVDLLTAGSSCLVWLLCDFPDFIPSCCPCSSFF